MNTDLLEAHYARVGVDPLSSAFAPTTGDGPAREGGGGQARPPQGEGAAERARERVAALKAAMPAHAVRIFETWQAAAENSPARAEIEAAIPPHALRALATLAEAAREARVAAEGGVRAREWAEWVRDTPVAPGRPLAVYTHFPFCAARCAFCPFYRYADPADWRPYRDGLWREIELAAAPFAAPPEPVAIYFGGGTPSDLPGEVLAELVERMRERFRPGREAEITVEGRPSTLDAGKVARLRAAGVNRFSLGVQTFDGGVRQAMGRRLDGEAVRGRLREVARAAGEAPIIIDLIYGLPGQTEVSWERDLDTVIEEESVAGLDLYRLKVFPGSPLARLVAGGRAAVADDGVLARRYVRGVERLQAAGFRRLSRWHWARDGRERSVYNRLAKGAGDIIPLGCGAGGRWGGVEFMNAPVLAGWAEQVAAGRKVCPGRGGEVEGWRESLSEQIEARRLESSGWPGAGPVAVAAAERLLAQWSGAGLLEPCGAGWRMTPAGEYWSDRLLHSLQTVLAGAGRRGLVAEGRSAPVCSDESMLSKGAQTNRKDG